MDIAVPWIGNKMKRFALIAVLFLITLGGALFLFLKATEPKVFKHRFKLALTVDDNGVKRSGSNIIQVTWLDQNNNRWISGLPSSAHVLGDAPVVELENGGAVVATLTHAGSYPDSPYETVRLEYLVAKVFRLKNGAESIPELGRQTGGAVLTGKEIPSMVYFSDRTDPKTARLVRRPIAPGGLIAPGVTFVEARIDMTTAPVTRNIEQTLPWWPPPPNPPHPPGWVDPYADSKPRPAWVALQASLQGDRPQDEALEPERLFRR
jgi:hypothetical protein